MYTEHTRDNLIKAMRRWTDGSKHILVHKSAPKDICDIATLCGDDNQLLKWIADFPFRVGAIYVVGRGDLLYDMKSIRPSLEYIYVT